MVEATSVLDLLVVSLDVLAHQLGGTEIKGSTLYLENLAGRNARLVDGQVEVSVDLQFAIQLCRRGIGDARQREEGVVRHVHDGLLVGRAAVVDDKLIVIGERVLHRHAQFTGESLLIVGKRIAQYQFLVIDLLGIPHAGMTAGGTAMQVVHAIVAGQRVFLAIHGKLTLADAVAVATDEGREERFGTVDHLVDVGMSLDDVGKVAVTVGHHDSHHGTAVVGHLDLNAIVITQCVEVSLFSLYYGLKVFALQARQICLFHLFMI